MAQLILGSEWVNLLKKDTEASFNNDFEAITTESYTDTDVLTFVYMVFLGSLNTSGRF